MRVRLRGPAGQHTAEVATEATFGDLKSIVAEKTGIPPQAQELLAGFPPKLISPTTGDAATCASLGMSDGESIMVRELKGEASAAAAGDPKPSPTPSLGAFRALAGTDEDEELAQAIAASLAETGSPPAKVARTTHVPLGGQPNSSGGNYEEDGTVAQRRVIDSDNSCLFNAVGYVMLRSLREAPALRRVIADAVSGDPFTYTEGFLGKSNMEYCKWILDKQHWGGAVELSILAKHFGREIAAYDIQTQRCDVYGSGEGYAERTMLLYDGLHYDAMVLAYEGAPQEMDITIFSSTGAAAEAADRKARLIVAKAHSARQFTDTANFSLRCLVCQQGLKGEKEAVEHAKATGHQNFGEY